MYLTQHQRIRVRRMLPTAVFDGLPGEPPETVVSVSWIGVAVWNQDMVPIVGVALTDVEGLPMVACCDLSEAIRSDIATALGVGPMILDGIVPHRIPIRRQR